MALEAAEEGKYQVFNAGWEIKEVEWNRWLSGFAHRSKWSAQCRALHFDQSILAAVVNVAIGNEAEEVEFVGYSASQQVLED